MSESLESAANTVSLVCVDGESAAKTSTWMHATNQKQLQKWKTQKHPNCFYADAPTKGEDRLHEESALKPCAQKSPVWLLQCSFLSQKPRRGGDPHEHRKTAYGGRQCE